MRKDSQLLDDLAKMLAGAAGNVVEGSRELQRSVKERLERGFSSLNLVSREEFEVARDMASKAREEQEKLIEKMEALERRLAELEGKKGL